MTEKDSTQAARRHRLIPWVILGFALVGAVLVLVATSRYGPGVSPDSVAYLTAARDLASDGHLGHYFLKWPPFFPVVLGAVGWVGVEPMTACRVLHALIFGGIIGLSAAWLRGETDSPVWPVGACVLTVFSTVLLDVSHRAWSEPLFILLSLVALWAISRSEKEARLKWVLLGALATALAWLTRYIGVTVAVSGGIILFLEDDWSWKKRFGYAGLFLGISGAPIVMWLARNWFISGTLTGQRYPAQVALWENVSRAGSTLAMMFLPDEIVALVPGAAWFLAVIGLASGLVCYAGRQRKQEGLPRSSPTTKALSVFLIVYVTGLLITATLIRFDPIGMRLLSPVYVPLVLLALVSLADVAEMKKAKGNPEKKSDRAVVLVCLGALVLWLPVGITRTVGLMGVWLEEGAGGYNRARWRESETLAYVAEREEMRPLVSNAAGAVQFVTGRPVTRGPTESMCGESGREDGYLIWFKDVGALPYLLSLSEFRACREVELVADFEDGAVYRIGRQ